jgi:hypothetical protein
MSIRLVTSWTIAVLSAVLSDVSHGQAAGIRLWQGAFRTPSTWGSMELRVSRDSTAKPRLRFSPDARLSEPEITNLRLTDERISFATILLERTYRFEGTKRRDRWEGSVVAADNVDDRGTWALSRLEIEDAASIANEPLPTPTGRYGTGRVAFSWVDKARPELETRLPDDNRELLVYVFYPAEVTEATRTAYMPEADVMLTFWKDDLTQRLKALRAYSREGIGVVSGRNRFPVLVFAPGGGQKALAYTTLLEDLASHGYVVAAIEPPYNAPAMQFPDGRNIGRLTPAERGWEEPKTRDDQPRIYEQMVLHWARDMAFVLDELTRLNNSKDPLFAGRLDGTRVGAFGHSRGGQAAGTVRLLDSRFRGGINLDGNIRGRGFQPINGADGGAQPFLWIEKHTPVFNDKELEKMGLPQALYEEFLSETTRTMQSVRGGAAHVTITRPGIEHLDFSDNPFWNATMDSEVRAGKRRTVNVVRAYMRAFFDGCVKGEWSDFQKLIAENTHPEVSSIPYGKIGRN